MSETTHFSVSAASEQPLAQPVHPGIAAATPTFSEEQPKRPSTAILSLKARRDKIKESLYIDLQVPRWEDPEIFVRFGPIDSVRSEQAIERRRKSNTKEFGLLANADILAQCCIGVYACLDGDHDTKYSLNPDDPEGPWTRFDPDLARNLGLITDAAVDVVRALYYTDGDLIQAATTLVDWSGKTNAQLDSDFSTP
jgi:hypothetical protein